ncbi:hypothetical protein, partial [Novosphingobium sp.]|uniref:hypothetical protein n=1 Tax=Novosphingobium sp. TaxID=1874826 RepID=UPI002FDEA783
AQSDSLPLTAANLCNRAPQAFPGAQVNRVAWVEHRYIWPEAGGFGPPFGFPLAGKLEGEGNMLVIGQLAGRVRMSLAIGNAPGMLPHLARCSRWQDDDVCRAIVA